MTKNNNQQIVFSTPWFEIAARIKGDSEPPYYVVQAPDCVSIVGITKDDKVLLVRQHRITIHEDTLEFPSGHIGHGEKPILAAKRELLEETGYQASDLELLGVIATDTGRLGNKLWCYYTQNLTFIHKPNDEDVTGVIACMPDEVAEYMTSGKMIHAQDIAAFFLAVQKGKLALKKGA